MNETAKPTLTYHSKSAWIARCAREMRRLGCSIKHVQDYVADAKAKEWRS